MNTIKGELLLDIPIPINSQGIVSIRLDDVSKMDFPSTTIAKSEYKEVSMNLNQRIFPFTLDIGNLPMNQSYAFWAHVDLKGNGEIEKGDYITQEFHGLDPCALLDFYQIKVKQIK